MGVRKERVVRGGLVWVGGGRVGGGGWVSGEKVGLVKGRCI